MTDNAKRGPVGQRENTSEEPSCENENPDGLAVEVDGPDIDIVAIHDIGGHRRKTWTKDDDTEECWLPEAYPNARILLYGYDSSGTTGIIYTRQGIYREANRLLETLRVHRESADHNQKKRSIVFICHGIGGLVIKAAFVLASRNAPMYEKIVFATRALVFITYPASHNPESIHVTRERLAKHLMHLNMPLKPGYRSQIFSALCETTCEVENLFIHSKVRSHALFLDVPSETDLSISKDYFLDTLAPVLPPKPYEFFEALKMARSDNWLYGDIKEHFAETLQCLSSQVSPNLPFVSLRGPDTIPLLDNFLATRDGSMLHVRSEGNACRSAEFVSQYLRLHSSAPVEILRFDFNPHDVRFNNIAVMLRTWLCQISFRGMASRNWPIQGMLEYMRELQAWTGEDLVLFWHRFVIDSSTDKTVYVVGGLDQCDGSRKHFVSSLRRILTETEAKLRIIVTTTKECDADMRDELDASMLPEVYQELEVDASRLSTKKQEDLPVRLALLFQQHPRFVGTGLEHRIAKTLSSSQCDDDLEHIVTSWLACDHIPLRIFEHHAPFLSFQSPEVVFKCILSAMPTERRNWARYLLFWVLQSVRAIRTDEFLAMSQEIHNGSLNENIRDSLRWFGGLLRVQYDEVQLGHPRLRNWLNSDQIIWWYYGSEREGHFDIMQTCLGYLRAPGTHGLHSTPPQLHPLPYAVQYWHVHYEAVHGEHAARQLVLEFFADTMAFKVWINAYVHMADPFTEPDPSAKRPFPIASHLGLYTVVRVLENKYPDDLEDALIEASRKGHLRIVRHLIPLLPKTFALRERTLEKLIRAAASCGNDQVMEEVLSLISSHDGELGASPPWISDMLLKACWMGSEQLVQVLLDLGADPRTTMPTTRYSAANIRPLDLAIQSNKIGVIKLLLHEDSSLGSDDIALEDMLGKWASKEVADLLLADKFRAGANATSPNWMGWTELQFACAVGRPIFAHQYLDQNPNSANYIDPDSVQPVVFAAWNDNPKTVKVLLQHGVNVNDVSSAAPKGNALYYAIQNDRLDMCQFLVEYKVDINYTAKGSLPPILKALSCGPKVRLDVIRLLLDNGADPERTEGADSGLWGRTALLVMCARGSQDGPEIIKLLLDHSVDINVRDSEGWTPIYTAAYFGLVNNVTLLIDAGADLYAACGNERWNALQGAYHKHEVVDLLLDKGIDPFEKYEADASALQLSARYNKPACVKAMLEMSGERKESAITEALIDAINFSSAEAVRILLDHGTDVNRTHGRRTLLSLALEAGSEGIIQMLLEFRPELDHRDLGDKTLLHFIGTKTTVSSIKLVIHGGAKVDGLDNDVASPLFYAISRDNTDAARYLLTKPAVRLNINICGRYGAPLHQACLRASLETVKALIENGADANLAFDGPVVAKTPIEYACMSQANKHSPDKEMIIRYLLEVAAAVPTGEDYTTNPIHIASLVCPGDLIKLFIQHGADPEQGDEIDRKPTQLACYNSLSALDSLNPSDQDFAARDKLGRVALHFSVLSGQLDLLKYVLERSKLAGIDIDVTDNDGWTPLLWAARGTYIHLWDSVKRDSRAEEVTGFLLANGASPGARGHVLHGFERTQDQLWSASDIAAYHGRFELADRLRDADPSTSREGKATNRHKSKLKMPRAYCNICYVACHSTYFICRKCKYFDLCFKCYRSRDAIHAHHDLEMKLGERDDDEESLQPRATEASSADHQHEGHRSEDFLDDEVVSNDED